MAHIGQNYPVLFRRDLNLNVTTNREGWPRRVIVNWSQFPTGPAGIWSNSRWDCGPDSYPALGTILWKSDQVLKFGVHWWTEFEATITAGFQYRKKCRLQTVELGLILELTYGLVTVPRFFRIFFDDVSVSFWDPNSFDQFPATALNTLQRGKLWTDGPPH